MEIKKANDITEDGFYLLTTPDCPACNELKYNISECETEGIVNELSAYECEEICMKFSIIGTPCLLDIRNDKEYDRMYGAKSRELLESFFKGE